MDQERGNFSGRIVAIMAAAGSAVGLGNIWRFSYEVGGNGGGVFIFIYLLCILCFGLPLMVTEFAIGRHGQSNTSRAYGLMGGSKIWKYVGLLGIIAAVLILCYYGVAAGWVLEYLIQAGMNGFEGKTPEQFTADFNSFVSDPWRPVLCMGGFMALNMVVILAGVKGGIERGSKTLMPILFIFVVVLAVACVMLPGSEKGLAFLFKPDFSKLTPSTCLSAMGQCFYSLSLAMGCICTYASYFRKEDKLVNNALGVITLDTFVAIMASLIIFPAAFSVGINPDAGPSLVFITLPNVFQQVFAAQPWLGYIVSLMFYLLLLVATLTSTMSLLEVPTIYLKEEFGIRRRWSAIGCTLFVVTVGIGCSLSMGIWGDYKVCGLNLFDLFDSVTAKILLPVGGFLTAIYIGWFCDRKKLYNEITNNGTVSQKFYSIYLILIRFVVPIVILSIFLNQFGFFS